MNQRMAHASIVLNEQTALSLENGKIKMQIRPVCKKKWKEALNEHAQHQEQLRRERDI